MVISNESVEPSQPLIDRIIQSIHRVWLDSTIDENRELYCSYVASLRQVINTITFSTVGPRIVLCRYGKPTDKFIRIVSQHLARQLPNDHAKSRFMENFATILKPFMKDKGYDWEVNKAYFVAYIFSSLF